MDLFSEIIQAVQDDLTVGDESSLYPLALVKRAVNRSYRKSSALFNWPDLENAKTTSSVINQEYYDYPREFRADSIWRIEMDDNQYGEEPDGSPMDWHDYRVFRADSDNDNSTEKKWATQRRRYFIFPVPTTNGSNNISVWGQRIPDALAADADVTIFSYSMPEGNEAIILEAVAILKSKGENEKAGQFRSTEAKQLLIVAWGKIQKEQAKYEKVLPFFDVPNYYGDGKQETKNKIGRF